MQLVLHLWMVFYRVFHQLEDMRRAGAIDPQGLQGQVFNGRRAVGKVNDKELVVFDELLSNRLAKCRVPMVCRHNARLALDVVKVRYAAWRERSMRKRQSERPKANWSAA